MIGFASAASVALLGIVSAGHRPPPSQLTAQPSRLASLSRTWIAARGSSRVNPDGLTDATGRPFSLGRWSLLFFGFTACPLVCPKTLMVLSSVARDPRAQNLSLVFVSIDPERDTRERMGLYLKHFDPRLVGITGSRGAVARFSAEVGAGSLRVGSAIDHSTSIFVLNPEGRVAGVILRPNSAEQVLADFAALREQHAN